MSKNVSIRFELTLDALEAVVVEAHWFETAVFQLPSEPGQDDSPAGRHVFHN
jgi:hypothetical protein